MVQPDYLPEVPVLRLAAHCLIYKAAAAVLSMSAAGNYVAVLYSDELVIYDRTLQVCAQLTAVNSTKQVLMRADGSAVLVGTDSAGLYLP